MNITIISTGTELLRGAVVNTNLAEMGKRLLAISAPVRRALIAGDSRLDLVNALEAVGIRVVVSNADSIEGVYQSIRMTGGLMGRKAEAEVLIADMQATFDEIRAKSVSENKTVYFEVSPLQWACGAAARTPLWMSWRRSAASPTSLPTWKAGWR